MAVWHNTINDTPMVREALGGPADPRIRRALLPALVGILHVFPPLLSRLPLRIPLTDASPPRCSANGCSLCSVGDPPTPSSPSSFAQLLPPSPPHPTVPLTTKMGTVSPVRCPYTPPPVLGRKVRAVRVASYISILRTCSMAPGTTPRTLLAIRSPG